jgi:transcriptional regulator with XRE-family HTH domain
MVLPLKNEGMMSRTLDSPRHRALVAFLKKKRDDADLSQKQVAKRLNRYQSFVATFEGGQKRIDAVELIQIAEAIGFDPEEAIKVMVRVKE